MSPTMAMPSLAYLSRDWECSEEIRDHVRRTKRILDWDDVATQKVNIKNADRNFHVLKPLASRLVDSNGEVGMHVMPTIQKQTLDVINLTFCFSPKQGTTSESQF